VFLQSTKGPPFMDIVPPLLSLYENRYKGH